MGVIAKVSITLVGATGVAGGGVLVYKLTNKNTISKNINPSYLLRSEDTAKWAHRINLLKTTADKDLSSDLLSKRKGNFSIEDLKTWCSESLESEFLGKEDKKFKNVRLYCGINMSDKVTGTKVSSSTEIGNTELKTKFESLNGKAQDRLVSELFSIKSTANTGSQWLGNKALKEWCLKALDMPVEEGLTYDNAKDYCVIST